MSMFSWNMDLGVRRGLKQENLRVRRSVTYLNSLFSDWPGLSIIRFIIWECLIYWREATPNLASTSKFPFDFPSNDISHLDPWRRISAGHRRQDGSHTAPIARDRDRDRKFSGTTSGWGDPLLIVFCPQLTIWSYCQIYLTIYVGASIVN